MPKILVRSTDALEQLDQLANLLRTEGEEVIKITEEEPLSKATQQDASERFLWFISEQADAADGLFNVVIASDETTISGADMVVTVDNFSPSAVIDEVKSRFDEDAEIPLVKSAEGYVIGDSSHLEFIPGDNPHNPSDPEGVLQLWKQRLAQSSSPGAPMEQEEPAPATEQTSPADEDEDEDASLAIPRINVGQGW